MENETKPATGIKGLVQWAITPPQSYVVYLVCLFAIFALSFYAGTMRPKNPIGMAPPTAAVPRQ